MGILGIIIKLILLILLYMAFFILILVGILLIAPIRYTIYFEKYDAISYEIKMTYLKGLKGYFIKEKEQINHQIKIFGKTVYRNQSETKEETKVNLSTHLVQDKKEKKVVKSSSDSSKRLDKENDKVKEKKKVSQEKRGLKDYFFFKDIGYDVVKEIFKLLKCILKVIAPSRWDFQLIVGKGDPAETGECIAKLIMLYPLYYKHGIIQGDYERECLEGGFWMEGRFRIGQLLFCFISFLTKSSVRKIIKIFLDHKEEDKHGE